MFVATLTVPQQEALLELAARMSEADGRVTDSETLVLAQLMREAGNQELTRSPVADLPSLTGRFDSRAARVAAYLELIGVAYADTELDATEDELLHKVAAEFGFDETEASDMEQWVNRLMSLMAQAKIMMQGATATSEEA